MQFENEEIVQLRKQLRQTRLLALVALTLPCVLIAAGWQWSRDVLRVRGIVITDELGRDRILIGSPTPESKTRKRKDNTSSIVFLEEDGSDRILIGEAKGFGRQGKTIPREREYGLLVHDKKGDERGGFGVFDSGKVSLALDRAHPDSDGVGLLVDDSLDFAGLLVNHKMKNGRYIQGMGFGIIGGKNFMNMDDPDGKRRLSLELADGWDPALKLWDREGKLRDALSGK